MIKQLKTIKNPGLANRVKRKLRIRRKVSGTAERPRVNALKSNKHLSIQVIDDIAGKTLFSVHTFGKGKIEGATKNKEGAKQIGKLAAEKLKEKGIAQVVFDRNGFRYTGIIAALADAMRENGIRL